MSINTRTRAFELCSRDRSNQKNFQLIVITHDMEFVDVLGQPGYTEYYYKVSKEVGYVEELPIQCFLQ